MKKFILILLMFTAAALYSQKNSDCRTTTIIQGVSIFIESEPLNEYRILDYERHRVKWYPDPSKDLERIVKKVKKHHPTATGLIFRLNKKRRADIIEFM